MPTSWKSRRILVPTLVGVFALVAAVVLGYVTVRDTLGRDDTAVAETAAAESIPTRRLVSERGGYAVAVPRGLQVERVGATLRLTSSRKDLAVVVGPAGAGSLGKAERGVLGRMRTAYRDLTILGKDPMQVDGHPSRTTFGNAVNEAGTKVRFALVTVHAGKRNYSIAAYAAHDSDPAFILPRVNAVANGFEVLTRAR